MRAALIFILVSISLTCLAQRNPVTGYWNGKMQSQFGKYEFSLSVQPQRNGRMLEHCGSKSNIKAVATHNRHGLIEVIELDGILYGDNSVYFSDVKNRFSDKDGEGKFSRLQFQLKFESGEAILDGHWQEYMDVKKYRKGRLVLKKGRTKA